MIVNLKIIFDPLFSLKFQKLYNDLILSQNFFQDKHYGASVKEISGGLVCETEYQLRFIGLGQEYNKRKKMISFLVKMDYDFVKDSDENVVYEKSIKIILESLKEFSKLDMKEFNADKFIDDFKKYISLVQDASKDEMEKILPPLNDETLKVYDTKWKKFLND